MIIRPGAVRAWLLACLLAVLAPVLLAPPAAAARRAGAPAGT